MGGGSTEVKRMGAAALSLLALIALAAACAFAVAPRAFADGYIGRIEQGSSNVYYRTYSELKSDLANLGGKTATVVMACDWNGGEVGAMSQLVIPKGSRITLNMDGHVIDRGLVQADVVGGSESGGGVILVQSGALLTVNGGAHGGAHDIAVFHSEAPEIPPSQAIDITGGLIAGGSNKGGAGGIHVCGGATVTLNDVTVAGCKAQDDNGKNGIGGGIYVEGKDATVNLNGSTIERNFAARGGGGFSVGNTSDVTIKLDNAHVDGNFTAGDGGGMRIEGTNVKVSGDAGSSFSGNYCNGSGGGACLWSSSVALSGFAVANNRSQQNGGGVYARHDGIALEDLVLTGNFTRSSGGAVCLTGEGGASGGYAGNSSISSCTITGNSGYRVGGVFIDDNAAWRSDRKRSVIGKTVIKDNSSQISGALNDLSIKCASWDAVREGFDLSEGAEVWVGLDNQGTAAPASPNIVQDRNCVEFLKSNQAGYYFRYDTTKRKNDRVPGDAPSVPVQEKVVPADVNGASGKNNDGWAEMKAGRVGMVGRGGGTPMGVHAQYDLIRGFYLHDTEDRVATFYYSDGLFYGDPAQYNEHFATLSWTFAHAGGYLETTQPADGNGNTYYNKHAAARQFLADIGCADDDIYVNDNMTTKPGIDTIGVSIGSKELRYASTLDGDGLTLGEATGEILVPVVVRGINYESEWVSNVTIGTAESMGPTKEAEGFSSAATQVKEEIDNYLTRRNLKDEYGRGKLKFWVVGYSRSGATANLVSKRLVEQIAADESGNEVFGYTCEAAKGGTDDAEQLGDKSAYYCIHNMVNKVDVVPYVAPAQMGFKRYGVDHYIPGTDAGSVTAKATPVIRGGAGGPTTVTTYADNNYIETKTSDYNAQRAKMREQLRALDSSEDFDDSFRPKAMDFVTIKLDFMKIYDNGAEAGNRIEDFVEDFVRFLQEGLSPGEVGAVGQAAPSRDAYAKDVFSLNGTSYTTIQTAFREIMKIMMGKSGSNFKEKAGKITDTLSKMDMAATYLLAIGSWNDGSLMTESMKQGCIRSLWDSLAKTGALDEMSASEKAQFEKCFPTLVNMAFNYIDGDYNYKPKDNSSLKWAKGSDETMMYLATFLMHSDFIIQCHMPEVNTAWARSYDSWYASDLNEYAFNRSWYGVAAPKAYQKDGDELVELEGGSAVNRLSGDQRVFLDNGGLVGEAVYYDLTDTTTGTKLATNQVYRGGIDLTLGDLQSRSFRIDAYDMSYGVKSGSATYRVSLNAPHKVIVWDLPDDAASGTAGGAASAASTGVAATGQGSSGSAGLMAAIVPEAVLLQGAGDSKPEGWRERVFTFAGSCDALVQAGVPGSKFFKKWKVEVLDANGNVVGMEATVRILGSGDTSTAANPSVAFEMPSVDNSRYPENFQLRFTASYGDLISMAEVVPSAPVAGQPLANAVPVRLGGAMREFEATWSYVDNQGKTVPVAYSGDSDVANAYNDTEYTATIRVDQDKANDVMFASEVDVTATIGSLVAEAPGKVGRNADGSITIVIAFPVTGTGGASQPGTALTLTVTTLDLNTGAADPDTADVAYSVTAGEKIKITAPDAKCEKFEQWDFGNSGVDFAKGRDPRCQTTIVKIPDGATAGQNLVITAQYKPVVSKVEVSLRNADGSFFEPVGGGAESSSMEMFVTIANRYQIHPDDLVLSWSPAPEDGKYAFLTDYTGTVKISPTGGDGKARAKIAGQPDGAYAPISLQFVAAEDIEVVFNGSAENVSFDADEHEASKAFPKTTYTLDRVVQPAGIEGVAFKKDMEASDIKALLPATVKVLATSGAELDAAVTWETPTRPEAAMGCEDPLGAVTWTANGTVLLPEGVIENPNGASLDVQATVAVDAASCAPSPSSSLAPGEYFYDQLATLSAYEGTGEICYTTDGSDPRDSATARVYGGEEIHVNRADAISRLNPATGQVEPVFTIKAYATGAAALQPSAVSVYEYMFADIPVPEGAEFAYDGEERIGVEASPFYTLEVEPGSGARIDEWGNAVAAVPGDYQVTAKLNLENDHWAADADRGILRTANAMTINFKIAGDPPPAEQVFTVQASASPAAGGGVVGAGTYVQGNRVRMLAWPVNGYHFVNWTENGQVVGTSRELTFEASQNRTLTANFALNEYAVKFVNYNGAVLQSVKTTHGKKPTYTKATPKKPATAKYYYVFKAWSPKVVEATGEATYKATFTQKAKASQVISAKTSVSKSFKASAKTKKLAANKTVNLKTLAKVSAKTTVKYAKANTAGGKLIVVNAKTGKVTLKKGLKVGKYNVKVKLTAPAGERYLAAKAKTITLKVVVKV